MALAIPREACLLGAPRCHGIGMLVGAFGICKEQVREAILEASRTLRSYQVYFSMRKQSTNNVGSKHMLGMRLC
uniref:Uncharacterized protein n=1 Tax=Oryza barthii TaxID=65489 RepID=A0A0D3HUL4_9ORYZ